MSCLELLTGDAPFTLHIMLSTVMLVTTDFFIYILPLTSDASFTLNHHATYCDTDYYRSLPVYILSLTSDASFTLSASCYLL